MHAPTLCMDISDDADDSDLAKEYEQLCSPTSSTNSTCTINSTMHDAPDMQGPNRSTTDVSCQTGPVTLNLDALIAQTVPPPRSTHDLIEELNSEMQSIHGKNLQRLDEMHDELTVTLKRICARFKLNFQHDEHEKSEDQQSLQREGFDSEDDGYEFMCSPVLRGLTAWEWPLCRSSKQVRCIVSGAADEELRPTSFVFPHGEWPPDGAPATFSHDWKMSAHACDRIIEECRAKFVPELRKLFKAQHAEDVQRLVAREVNDLPPIDGDRFTVALAWAAHCGA